jgi:hypothetical protein
MPCITFKKPTALYAAILGIAAIALLAGCPEADVIIDYTDNEMEVQITVVDKSTGNKSVVLEPTVGRKTDSAYRWTIGPNWIPDNANQVLTARIGEYAYKDFEVEDVILSFLLKVDEEVYAGWDSSKYGTVGIGDGSPKGQGYGYAVLCGSGDGWSPGWHSSLSPTKPAGTDRSVRVTARYTVTIDSDVMFVLDEVAYGEPEYP